MHYTVYLSHYGKEDDCFDMPVREAITKTALIKICEGHICEPIWVFYRQEIIALLILEESYFTPVQGGTYLVARTQDLRDYPNTVEALKSGVRTLEPAEDFPYFSRITNRLIENVMKRVPADSWIETIVSCKRLGQLANGQKTEIDGRVEATSISVSFDADLWEPDFLLEKESERRVRLGQIRNVESDDEADQKNKSVLKIRNRSHFLFFGPSDTRSNRRLDRFNEPTSEKRLTKEEMRLFEPTSEKRLTKEEMRLFFSRYRFKQVTLNFDELFDRTTVFFIEQVRARRLHFRHISTYFRPSEGDCLTRILEATTCSEISGLSEEKLQNWHIDNDIIRRFRFV